MSSPTQPPQTHSSAGQESASDQHADINVPEGDDDSALGDEEDILSTSSLSSSIFEYRQENGRTYNSYGERTYVLPNDESELDRLDLQHHLMKLTFGDKLMTTNTEKLDPSHRVLDCGTGTGIWAMEYGDLYPLSSVIGVDVSPVQPAFVPPNVKFEIADIETPWTFTTPFDFIFIRMLTGGIGNWPRVLEQAFEHLNPGGYLEVMDISFDIRCNDNTLLEDSAFARWVGLMLEASINLGSPLLSIKSIKSQMEDAGYVEVKETGGCWPINWWPKDPIFKKTGLWSYHNIAGGLYGLSAALFTRGLGWSLEELEILLVDVRKELKNPKIHAYWPLYAVSGKKRV